MNLPTNYVNPTYDELFNFSYSDGRKSERFGIFSPHFLTPMIVILYSSHL